MHTFFFWLSAFILKNIKNGILYIRSKNNYYSNVNFMAQKAFNVNYLAVL